MNISTRELFLQHVGQTSDFPMMLEIEKAEGIYLIDTTGRKYIDFISGVSVSNLGHGNKEIVEAVKDQLDKYMHLMVYGEYVQSPQVLLAKLLTEQLPDSLSSVYYVNSGSEAIEGALKLAKRYTGRSEIIAFKNAYHGSTHGALSLMSEDTYSLAFRPLLPDVRFININNEDDLDYITHRTACVVAEVIQAEAGILPLNSDFLHELRSQCTKTGTLLIFDEVQTGFGRTGSLFAFMKYNVIPDVLCIAKAFGGGMPLGAFISSKKIMESLKNNPVLGHITTFGGHPVCCAAALASLKILLNSNLIQHVHEKERVFKDKLKHPYIKEVRGEGLLLAVDLGNHEMVSKTLKNALKSGLVSDWFLYNDTSLRIAPPLIISKEEIDESCEILIKSIENRQPTP